jgi:hypothetical protein
LTKCGDLSEAEMEETEMSAVAVKMTVAVDSGGTDSKRGSNFKDGGDSGSDIDGSGGNDSKCGSNVKDSRDGGSNIDSGGSTDGKCGGNIKDGRDGGSNIDSGGGNDNSVRATLLS